MQGVEVINTIHTYERLISPIWALCLWGVALIICFTGALTVDYVLIQRFLKIAVGCVGTAMFICMILACVKTNKIIDTKYEVLVSDKVSYEELCKHYDVIEYDNGVFTVRDRNLYKGR